MKSGFVALIGRPNVGKSTLMNTLIGQKIAITSNKPQTTRNRIQTVFTDERGQIVFLDTPGIHKAKNKLGEYMVKVSTRTLRDVDMVLWLVEPSTFIGEGDEHIFEILSSVNIPVILAINKMDSLKQKEDMLEVIAKYSSRMQFAEVVPVSALKGTNTDKLLDIIFKYLSEGPMYYDEDTVTDQPIKQIAAELIREKALRFLQEEIPHGIAVEIDTFNYRDSGDMVDIEAAIVCEKDSHKGIIIGKGGSMLKRIGTAARKDIEGLLESRVNLKLWVKVRPKWRDSDVQMKNFGYNPKDL
ncbi:MAG: GTPase Era [Lachnoanaerobaculum sp.]|jgi:GTP-binding protein era|uniref:GTPase Era n=1 Tax=Lachnoanaerobaculum TaxID=1164882 RepID=UPI00027A5E39|nr:MULTISPECIES: GTPase Era [unclassified Lachnoanaerobaculum]RKW46112.1 MAG: GTPase Era [Lachnospiraceae bacterium]EJP22209.1 GTP-binding protein Era [Lachnoanaerobaculum sp. ICM7]EJZ70068.1 GTP-binding protein Era [Lachnoanaerobaculum sp. OBRC5-5]ETO95457.1 GTP-binding protein Era [Lachnoanaerobaculum sp. MSX33]MBS5881648.1 GTPase Era [Lachnoanaerobaculum sp.]